MTLREEDQHSSRRMCHRLLLNLLPEERTKHLDKLPLPFSEPYFGLVIFSSSSRIALIFRPVARPTRTLTGDRAQEQYPIPWYRPASRICE